MARTLVLPQTHKHEGATYSIYGQPGEWSRTQQLKRYTFYVHALCHKKQIYVAPIYNPNIQQKLKLQCNILIITR